MLDSEVQIKHFKEVLIEVSLGQEWEEDESIELKKFQPEIPDSLVCYVGPGPPLASTVERSGTR